MLPRRLRQIVRDPFWMILVGALVVGVIAGVIVAREQTDVAADGVFGKAWRADPKDTRAVLTTLFGIQLTVLTVVLSLNAPMIQSAANQYSPRLVPFYLKNAPLRRALPLFVLAGGYILAAVRELGFATDEAVRPRVVLSVAITLVVVAFSLLTSGMIRTFRFMRVERILGLVRDATFAAMARVEARTKRLGRPLPSHPVATLHLLPDASALRASSSGYLVEVDVPRLARLARGAGVRVRISRPVGDYVDEGEVVGWAESNAGGPVEPRVAHDIGATLAVAPTREPDFDPLYGIRILADVAARALSSSANDSYTSRQALQQLRSVLRRLARAPLGDWNVADPDGTVRVSVMARQLRELMSAAVEAPLRHGAGNPEVLDGVLEIALEVGLAACDAEGRAAAHQLVARVLDDALEYGKLDSGRLKRLLVEAELVRATLEKDCPRAERHVRSDWALTPNDGVRDDGPTASPHA